MRIERDSLIPPVNPIDKMEQPIPYADDPFEPEYDKNKDKPPVLYQEAAVLFGKREGGINNENLSFATDESQNPQSRKDQADKLIQSIEVLQRAQVS